MAAGEARGILLDQPMQQHIADHGVQTPDRRRDVDPVDEQALADAFVQHRSAVGPASDRVACIGVQIAQDGGLGQEPGHRRPRGRQHLLVEIGAQMMMVAGEGGDLVAAARQHTDTESDAGGPSRGRLEQGFRRAYVDHPAKARHR